jgi:predicted GH43/DUF377 family glycosyl hydrolase
MLKKANPKSKKVKNNGGEPLAVIPVSGGVVLLLKDSKSIFLSWSTNGLDFSTSFDKVEIAISPKKKEKIDDCSNFRVSKTGEGYIMTYLKSGKTKKDNQIVVAKSGDLLKWKVFSILPAEKSTTSVIIYDKKLEVFALFEDGLFIKNRLARSLSSFKEKPTLLFTSRNNHFDSDKISIIGGMVTERGILLLYDASIEHKNKSLLQVGAVVFDINDPKKILWRSSYPVWQGVVEADKKSFKVVPLGVVSSGENLLIYFKTSEKGLIVAKIKELFKEEAEEINKPKILKRFKGNPIIEPRNHHDWEGEGTFNPAVIEDDEGVIHLLYRAVGKDGISRVGYAQSKDGLHFQRRSSLPVYQPIPGFGLPLPENATGPIGYHPAIYTSGGGWGGAEDPRLIRIENTVYMMYVAFEGWNSVRIALTSISVDDFKNERWKWKKPVLLSPPGKINKNWLMFPEKINGKYAILHSIAPKVSIEYVDNPEKMEKFIDSPRPDGPQPGRKDAWDSVLRGAGPPPVKTRLGWLLLYHALEKKDLGKYKLGAMILDKSDPTKILYRSAHPILSPDMNYENNGKPGVVYASGAIIRDDNLYVYYGGADKVVCVASTPINNFLDYMVTGNAEEYQLKKA